MVANAWLEAPATAPECRRLEVERALDRFVKAADLVALNTRREVAQHALTDCCAARRERRCVPGMALRTDFAAACLENGPENGPGCLIDGNRMGDEVDGRDGELVEHPLQL